MSQMTFCRYEYKYLLTARQHREMLEAIAPYLALDQYGRSTVCSIYYDTPDFRLIRESLDRPLYKEKLRLRSYGCSETEGFLELKKKYDGVVYKRRAALPVAEAAAAMAGQGSFPDTQIGRELAAARARYPGLRPTVFLSCEREAYYDRAGSDFRLTFDENIRCRWDHLTMTAPDWGTPVLPRNTVLMELKLSQSIPLWMAQTLSRLDVHRISFSKYGKAYQDKIEREQIRQIG